MSDFRTNAHEATNLENAINGSWGGTLEITGPLHITAPALATSIAPAFDAEAFMQAHERAGMSAFEQHVAKWLQSHERKFTATAKGSELEISVMDVIGGSWWYEGVTAKSVKRALDANPNASLVRVLIDSPGGSVFDGFAIQALLKRFKATVEVEVIGEASSAASVIAMAGDTIKIHEGAMFMVHRAAAGVMGFASDHRAIADALDKITDGAIDLYVARTGLSKETVTELVNAETWMSAREAVEKGFADELVPGKAKQQKAAAQSAVPAKKGAKSAPANLSPEALRELLNSDDPNVVELARVRLESAPRSGVAAFIPEGRTMATFTQKAIKR